MAFDANCLVRWSSTAKEDSDSKARLEHFVDTVAAEGGRIVIPTPAFAEFLVGLDEAAMAWIETLDRKLLADPRRIVQARAELHTGQQVQYLHWYDGKMRAARVVAMKDRRVTVFDEASRTHFTLPYAAIVTTPASGSDHGADASVQAKPTPPPEIASRADFRVGNRVSFTDRNLEHRVGLIVRINQRTATLDCDGQTWRVGFGLLRPLVDI